MAALLPADDGFLQYVIEDWPLRIVVLDTLLPGHDGGTLCAERLAWLAARLAAPPDRPTIVAMHHPPFRCGIGFMDALNREAAAPLAAVIAAYPNVERVLCGHVHRAIQTRCAATIASTCPSTAHQISLDLRAAADATYMLEPPGFQLHWWTGNDGLVTHTASVGPASRPFSVLRLTRVPRIGLRGRARFNQSSIASENPGPRQPSGAQASNESSSANVLRTRRVPLASAILLYCTHDNTAAIGVPQP